MNEVSPYTNHDEVSPDTNYIDLLYNDINEIGENIANIENLFSKDNKELREKLKLMEKELEEAKASSNNWKQKYIDLVNKYNQYESVLRDFDDTAEHIINNFNGIVCGIRITCSEGFIRKNYKEMNFTESGELPVYIYNNEILKHISSFISAIRSYGKGHNSTIKHADRKLSKRALKALRKYYTYFKM